YLFVTASGAQAASAAMAATTIGARRECFGMRFIERLRLFFQRKFSGKRARLASRATPEPGWVHFGMPAARRECHFRSLSPHGFHRVVYDEWGDPDNPRVVVCVHGIGRNARDFDDLASALVDTHRVLSVDMPGRGRSEWLSRPHLSFFLLSLHG